jgi:hypothetical protein
MSLYANDLRAQHHISGKTTFRTLCAPVLQHIRCVNHARRDLCGGHSAMDVLPR